MNLLADKLRQAFEHCPTVRLAILFGSRARGNARPDSDVDIAILPADPALSLGDEHELATQLERTARGPVDLVRLDQARPALKWRIARDGIVLVSNPPQLAPRFLARAGIEHDAARELELDAMRRYRARLAAATPGGNAMTDAGLILHKLERLRQQVALVRSRRPSTPEALSTDLVLRDAMALALLIALQEAIDIAYHVVADEGWGVPDSHAAAFDQLAAHGVIEVVLAKTVSLAARVHNRIAHGYASVDHARLWHELPEGLAALDAFAEAIASWLPAQPS